MGVNWVCARLAASQVFTGERHQPLDKMRTPRPGSIPSTGGSHIVAAGSLHLSFPSRQWGEPGQVRLSFPSRQWGEPEQVLLVGRALLALVLCVGFMESPGLSGPGPASCPALSWAPMEGSQFTHFPADGRGGWAHLGLL